MSKVVSSNPAVIALVQIIVSLATVALMFYVASAAFGMSAAIVALLFMGVDLTGAISSSQLLADSLFTFLLTAAIAGLFRISRKNSGLPETAAVGVGFSLVALCRPVGVFLFVPVAVWMGVTLVRKRRRWQTPVGVFVAGSLFLPLL